MDTLTKQQQALLWSKYWDLFDENNMLKLLASEKDEKIAVLHRELVNAKNKIAKLEQIIDPVSILDSHQSWDKSTIEELKRIIAETDKLAAMERPLQEKISVNDKGKQEVVVVSMSAFKPETMCTYQALVASCKEIQTLEGSNYRLKMKILGGDLFVYHIAKNGTEYYDIQWFGLPEPFGFCILPDRSIRGPYHFH